MGIDGTQRRLGVVILLVTLSSVAALGAAGTTQLLGGAFLPLDDEGRGLLATAATPGAGGPPLGAGVSGASRKDPMPILHRNIFDSATGPLDGTAPQVATNDGNGGGDTAPVPFNPNAPPAACEGALRLVGAFYMPRNPDASFAAIVDATGKAMLYRKGQALGERTIERVNDQYVILRGATAFCSLSMFSPLALAPPPPPPQVAVAEAPSDGSGIPTADLDNGITKISDNEYSVTRSLLNEVLVNQGAIMSAARVIPHEEGGHVVGLKLYGVRRGSILSRIGLSNGDTLRTINGYSMSSLDDGIAAFANLRNAEHLTVSVVRGGTPTNINYSIRP